MTEAQLVSPVFATSALAAIETHVASYGQRFADAVARTAEDISTIAERQRVELRQNTRERERLLAGGLAPRPTRRMPTLIKVAQFHGLALPPACVRCGYTPGVATWREAAGHLERAHVIDRGYGGLDLLCNILPLCPPCHRAQPIFRPADRSEALAWFGAGR